MLCLDVSRYFYDLCTRIILHWQMREFFNGIYYTCTLLGRDSWLHVRSKAHMREEHLKIT